MDTNKDKRNYSRIPTLKQVRCLVARQDRPDESVDVIVKDLSPGGIMFESREELTLGTLLNLEIVFPFSTTDEGGKVQGRVVHCRRNERTKRFDIGVAYVRNK